jgi:hypothetical protein
LERKSEALNRAIEKISTLPPTKQQELAPVPAQVQAPPGLSLPVAQAAAAPNIKVSAQTWQQEVKEKFLDDLQGVQISDPKLLLSVQQKQMKYSGEYPTCLLLYTPTGVTIEQIDLDKEQNEDLVSTINLVATKWTVDAISAAQQKHDVPE